MNPVEIAEVANDAADIGWLLLATVLALVMAAIGVVWLRNKIRGLPAKPSRSVGHQRLDLDQEERDIHPLIQVDRILRDDAESRPMTCREARQYFDLHDVFGDDRD